MQEEPSPDQPEKKNSSTERLLRFLSDKKGKRAAIFTHPCPDPDALGSMMGMAFLCTKGFEMDVNCFFDGHISHPQNMAMNNLLDPELKRVEEYDEKNFDLRILVDTIPSHAALGKHEVDFDVVIDHHKEAPNGGFKGLYLNLKAGSCFG